MTLVLALLSIVLGVLPLVGEPKAGIPVFAAALIALALFGTYVLYLRDRYGGLYRIIEDSDLWDLHGTKGRDATMTKTRRLSYLQSGVFAIRDYAWGTGEIRPSKVADGPGIAVYPYRDGQRENSIILLNHPADRDDEHVFKIERKFEGSFTEQLESVQADVLHETAKLTVTVLFSLDRQPSRAWLTCRLGDHEENEDLTLLGGPNGRMMITRSFDNPQQFALFTLNWEW